MVDEATARAVDAVAEALVRGTAAVDDTMARAVAAHGRGVSQRHSCSWWDNNRRIHIWKVEPTDEVNFLTSLSVHCACTKKKCA